jgi:PAS domain S-box-containing protein
MRIQPSTAKHTNQRILVLSAASAFALAVFIVDVLSPVGVEVWVFYLPVILAAAWLNDARGVVVSALACASLVILGALISPTGENPTWQDALNRGMGLLAMGFTAFTGITICRRSSRLAAMTTQLQNEVEEHQRTGADLRKSEERLQLAVKGSGMGTWDLDLHTGVAFWSDATFQMLGFAPNHEGKATREMWQTCVLPDDLPRVLDAQEQARIAHSLYSCEYQIRRADTGDNVWLASFGRYRYDEAGQAVRFAGVIFDITRRKNLEIETLEIAAREQRRIGQELHDGLGQELTGLGLMANALAQRLRDDTTERSIVDRLVVGFDRVHQQARRLARGLIPVHVETRGLPVALEDLAGRLAEQSGVGVTMHTDSSIDVPDHTTATQLFHIAQEAVTNAIRHANPTHVAMSLTQEPDGLRLAIRDDGTGISNPAESRGLGLRIMQYRADQIGGALHLEPAKGGGTLVICTLTRRQANASQDK